VASGRCVENGCESPATWWVLPLSTHAPVMCDEHAKAWSAAFKSEQRDPAEDRLAEMDALRGRLHAAEDVCYQVQNLLLGSLANIDMQIPALRTALRRWAAATKGL
jgi:hypothetical protein